MFLLALKSKEKKSKHFGPHPPSPHNVPCLCPLLVWNFFALSKFKIFNFSAPTFLHVFPSSCFKKRELSRDFIAKNAVNWNCLKN